MKRIAETSVLCCALLLISCGLTQSGATEPAETASAAEVPLERMSIARAGSKISVPVDVRYHLSGVAVREQPMTLELTFVPRVAGENLRVEFPRSDSVSMESSGGVFTQQKASSADVIRRSVIITPLQNSGSQVRVLVAMDVQGSRFFGIFTIPLDAAAR